MTVLNFYYFVLVSIFLSCAMWKTNHAHLIKRESIVFPEPVDEHPRVMMKFKNEPEDKMVGT